MLAFFLHTILILHHQCLYLSFHLTICRLNNILIPNLVFPLSPLGRRFSARFLVFLRGWIVGSSCA